MTAPYAFVGERITCESGHLICLAAQDIPLGALHRDEFFANWRQPAPKQGTPAGLVNCDVCGARWFEGATEARGAALHFEQGGWR